MRTFPAMRIFVVSILLLLGGCATTSSQGQRTVLGPYDDTGTVLPPPATGTPVTTPVPITRGPLAAPASPVETAMIPPPRTLPDYPKSAEQISGQAVLSLMKQAQKARAAKQYDQASGALERAQRIEPRNCFVWSALGRVYLEKQLYENAESVALKSNSLARGNFYVEIENWKVIAAAREAQGNAIGVVQAQARIEEIQRNLTGG